jgi:putative endonuclease
MRHYVGLTEDLKDRLRRHNAGEVAYTAKYRPWKVQVAVAFNDQSKALLLRNISKAVRGALLPNGISNVAWLRQAESVSWPTDAGFRNQ